MGGLEVIPEAVATQQGLNKGWRRFVNNHTLRGKTGIFYLAMFTTWGLVQAFQIPGKLKQRAAKKEDEKKKWAEMLVEMAQWEKNGKIFV